MANGLRSTVAGAGKRCRCQYHFAAMDQYFITASGSDQALLDSGIAPGWSRTGEWFKQGGSTPVCRFYGSVSPGPNSAFLHGDSVGVRFAPLVAGESTPATQQRLNFESLDFTTTPAVNGTCRRHDTGLSRLQQRRRAWH